MDIDPTIMFLLILLIIILGIFALSSLSSGGGSNRDSARSVSQYSGGGCGR